MELINSFIQPALSFIWNSFTQQLSYINAKKHVKDMTDAMEVLKAKRSDIRMEIQVAERKQQQPTEEVGLWLQHTEEFGDEVARVGTKYDHIGCRPFGGCSLNCWSLYGVGRRAADLCAKLTKSNTEGTTFNVLTRPVIRKGAMEIFASTSMAVGLGMELNLRKALSYLSDYETRIVGIWGTGGVGKTTLLQAINNRFHNLSNNYDCLHQSQKSFDHVIWVVASREPNLDRLRWDIAKHLGLPEESDEQSIREYLEGKDFLLLLDDLWGEVKLGKIGIPDLHKSTLHKRKVVFTTRSEQVCAHMTAQKKIKVECLNTEEAWKLFTENVNISEEIIGSEPDIRGCAEEVARRCGGLPLALIVIGRAMSTKKTPEEWSHALNSLKTLVSNIIPGMEDSIFPTLNYSYDNLRDNQLRECFLCCSLWPEDFVIRKNEIIMLWIGLGLIDNFDDIWEAYANGHFLIGNLMEACLLEPVQDSSEIIKMHDVIRGLAHWIATDCGRKRNQWVVRAGVDLEEVSEELKARWGEAQRVSLMQNVIKELPQELSNCPNLSTLILYKNKFRSIPQGFLQCMSALTYLDISYCEIEELPSAIGCLVELHYLNISYTSVSSLPDELQHLKKLKYLYLQYTPFLVTLPWEIISSLSKLLVLDLYPYGHVDSEGLQYLPRGLKALGIRVTSVQTLRQLSDVPTWHLYIDGLKDSTTTQLQLMSSRERQYLHWLDISNCSNLEELVMDSGGVVGDQDNPNFPKLEDLWLSNLGELKEITWKGGLVPAKCFKRLQFLSITGCHRLKNVTWVQRLPCLVRLILRDCNAIEQVIGDAQDGDGYAKEAETKEEKDSSFPKLKNVILLRLPKLVSISGHALDFPSLEEVFAWECPELKKLPFQRKSANKKLKKIVGTDKWWDSIDWEEQSIKSSLEPYFVARTNGVQLHEYFVPV